MVANNAHAATYYVDSSIADVHPASATPDYTNYDPSTFSTTTGGTNSVYKTIADVNLISLAPGDFVYFRKGQTWREQLTVPSSGSVGSPITFDAYGSTGASPIISGADLVTGWVATYQTLNLAVNANIDNAWDDNYHPDYYTDDTTTRWTMTLSRNDEGRISAAFRFANVTLPKSTAIIGATFSGYSDPGANHYNINTTLYGEATDTAANFSYLNSTPGQRTKTTASTSLVSNVTGWIFQDVTTIVQEIINRSGWASGNALNILSYSGASASTYGTLAGYGDSYPAKLSISYGSVIANIWNAPVTVTPQQVFRGGMRMIPESSVAALTADNEWYYDSTVQKLYLYTTTDPSTVSIEADNRPYAIYMSNKSYVTFNNLSIGKTSMKSSNLYAAGFMASSSISTSGITLNNISSSYNYESGIRFLTAGSGTMSNITLNNVSAAYNSFGADPTTYSIWFGGPAIAYSSNNGSLSNITMTNVHNSYSGVAGNGTATTSSGGIWFDNVQNATINNVESDHNGSSSFNVSNGSSNFTIMGGSFHDNGQASTGDKEGIGIGDDGVAPTNITVDSADVYGNVSQIDISFTTTNQIPTGIVIKNSRIHDSMVGAVTSGIGIDTGPVATTPPGVLLMNNLIYNNTNNGIAGPSAGPPNTYTALNNVVWNNANQGQTIGATTTTIIENNIFGQSGVYDLVATPLSPRAVYDYNSWYHSPAGSFMYKDDGVAGGYAHSSINNLAGWQALTGQDTHSTSSNPTFVSAGTNFALQSTSPLIDAGMATSTRTTDILGNPIYGTPDIGAYEYQPPFTIGTDKVDPTGNIRIYGDGKYRYTTATSSTMLADFSVAPPEGSWTYAASTTRPEWLNISNVTWNTSGTYSKQWTASASLAASPSGVEATTTVYTIGNLLANTYYDFAVDGTATSSVQSDSSGRVAYTYSGGYSTHTFTVTQTVLVPTPTPTVTTSYSSSGGGSAYVPPITIATTTATTTPTVPGCPKGFICTFNPKAAVPPAFRFTLDLSLGSTGDEVLHLQQLLTSLRYLTNAPTGYFGPLTKAAVIRYQIDNRLQGVGQIGPLTRALLNSVQVTSMIATNTSVSVPATMPSAPFTRSLALGSTGSDVKALQVFLNAHGFTIALSGNGSSGHETIYFGPATKVALMKFQQAYKQDILTPQGLTAPTGFFGTATMKVMNGMVK